MSSSRTSRGLWSEGMGMERQALGPESPADGGRVDGKESGQFREQHVAVERKRRTPLPDFAPFFVQRAMEEGLLEAHTNGATGVTPSSEVMNGRKRRGSVSSPRHDSAGTDSIDIAAVPPRRVSGRSQRTSVQVPRQRKLLPEQITTLRALAGSKSLRALAADFGVSHETIRSVLRQTTDAALHPKSLAVVGQAG
jgi:hypothetical protein